MNYVLSCQLALDCSALLLRHRSSVFLAKMEFVGERDAYPKLAIS
jgi:hypothetical protein